VPIVPTVTLDQAKAFCKAIAEYIASRSAIFVTNMRKDLRGGKIYIDYHRNGHSATAVAPYGLRARAGAAVSMPVSWETCAKLKTPADFTLQNARRHLAQRKADPWKDFAASRVDLAAIAAHTHLPHDANGNAVPARGGESAGKAKSRRGSHKSGQ
jgi:bifunctional non-homologous end joining protein LigD